MKKERIAVYFIPGLAANKEIFKNISLSEETFDVHYLEWIIPKKKEPIADYAKRMAEKITENNVVLVGVSFGGVVAQEMAAFLHVRKLIIISSVKSKNELPLRLALARKTLAYKLIPTRKILNTSDLTKFAIGEKSRKRLQLYQEFLSVRNAEYLDWAIENMVCWDRKEASKDVVHIHGDADLVFPIEKIKNCIVVKGGTHIMILNRFRWFNSHLPKLILDETPATSS